ncbi:redoxin domain-containing protein [filamentous cyanobacterium LEGE 11480]|uniref:Redoxin domain-containing protein n=1 Tax=Romeriopsis navalis LEGE 11480 TaxID=2777977 RepID=A0A928VKR5_9CYAN|nr:thioredoxin domain-containing protein [Romeriopsis navalis]MBE9030135.1 redoxin domain-containing protein [Romeriopsis navalis LEGE 11480]
MRIKYFAVLATVSMLSLGTIAACSNPCAAKTSGSSTEAASNPCAGKANPCAAKNPCAGKANPCASKGGATTVALAKELQGKPVLVDVYATWCKSCQKIAPTLTKLKEDYKDKVNFVVLDVTDKSTVAEAEATAKKLGLSEFLKQNKSQTSLVAIFDPATGKILAQHRKNANIDDYTTVLNAALN